MTPVFESMVTDMTDELNRPDQEPITPDAEEGEPPLLTKEEAIAEVKRWIERYKIDQNQILRG